MIAKIFEKKSAKSLYRYVNKDDGKYLGGTLIFNDENSFLNDFESYNGTKKFKKPALHIILSSPKNEPLTDEEWLEAANIYMEEMKLDPTTFGWALIKHTDTQHHHTHLISTKKDIENKTWNSSFSKYKSLAAIAKVEQELNLNNRQTTNHIANFGKKDNEQELKKQPPNSHHSQKRKAQANPKANNIFEQMQVKISGVLNNNKGLSISQYKTLLEQKGIELDIQTNQDKTIITGLVYCHPDPSTNEKTAFKSSSLGAKFMMKNLSKRLGYYNDLAENKPEPLQQMKIKETEKQPVEPTQKIESEPKPIIAQDIQQKKTSTLRKRF